MNRKTRILIELFGPAVLGTTLFMGWNWRETMNSAMGLNPYTYVLYLGVAVIASFIPAAIYAFCMEIWLTHEVRKIFGRPGVVGVSTLLGALAGYGIFLATEFQVSWMGAPVGLILGLVLCQTSTQLKASSAARPQARP